MDHKVDGKIAFLGKTQPRFIRHVASLHTSKYLARHNGQYLLIKHAIDIACPRFTYQACLRQSRQQGIVAGERDTMLPYAEMNLYTKLCVVSLPTGKRITWPHSVAEQSPL